MEESKKIEEKEETEESEDLYYIPNDYSTQRNQDMIPTC